MRAWVVVLSLVLGSAACTSEPPERPGSGPASALAPQAELRLGQPRAVHRATALGDGTVLITGGCTEAGCGGFDAGRRSEVYDPDTGLVAGASMSTGRASGTATLLVDGRVLLTGGYPGEGRSPTGSAEVYDPRSGEFTPVDDLGTARADHTASLLPDGRVLLAGGFDAAGRALADSELFDPDDGSFVSGPDLGEPRAAHVAVSVGNAVVLVGGTRSTEALATTEVYRQGRWRAGPELLVPRVKLGAAAIGSGRVLVVGGASDTEGHERLATTELLDLERGTVSEGPRLSTGEYKLDGAIATLPDGRVVIPSGEGLEVFDPATDSLHALDVATYGARSFRTMTVLEGNRVLLAGGYDESIVPTAAAVVVSVPEGRSSS